MKDNIRNYRKVGIVSVGDDLHTYIIASTIKERFNIACHVIETDKVAFGGNITWSASRRPSCNLNDYFGNVVDLAEVDVFWWRRFSRIQTNIPENAKEHEVDLINNDCRSTLQGMFDCLPEGKFVSAPQSTERSGNKLVQLKAAKSVGLSIPDTIISNNRNDIESFVREKNNLVVAKTLIGTSKSIVFTSKISQEDLQNSNIESVPGIYQELVDGDTHLRINVFGEEIICAEIKAKDLDWRRNLPSKAKIVILDNITCNKIMNLLKSLNLNMGVIDMKINKFGEEIFLELNPQGQFLFLEPLTGFNFTEKFSEFLITYGR